MGVLGYGVDSLAAVLGAEGGSATGAPHDRKFGRCGTSRF
jgi:hypothetical protein